MLLILYYLILLLMIIAVIWLLKILYNLDYFNQLENGCNIIIKS